MKAKRSLLLGMLAGVLVSALALATFVTTDDLTTPLNRDRG